ncbi:unnamed protein product [Paramecium sonneborni]|uniref:Uncharacterized protein n=1 Tax=Paramecium sonneborni TaxID=65129 RepID=A0A8S1JX99_9CILI|nr:unnamed protein product [Paramecium sonneborni]
MISLWMQINKEKINLGNVVKEKYSLNEVIEISLDEYMLSALRFKKRTKGLYRKGEQKKRKQNNLQKKVCYLIQRMVEHFEFEKKCICRLFNQFNKFQILIILQFQIATQAQIIV